MPKVTEFPQDSVIGGAEKIYVVDGSTDKYATLDQLKSIVNGHISSLASLKTYEGLADEQLIWLEGGTTVGDEKQGLFRWDAASTATADDEDIVQVTAVSTGRWIRQEGRYATDTLTGVVELATDAEVATGTDTTRPITPAGLFSTLSKSHAADGYQKFPNGLILQWGDVPASTLTTVSFPIAFPTAALQINISANGVSVWSNFGFYARIVSTSQFEYASSNVDANGLSWFAVGY